MKLVIYIAVMAGVTYLIRMLPMMLLRKPITNRFILSFLHYIPFAVLAAMTIPSIFHATQSPISASVGLAAAVVSAYFEPGLLPVALLSCAGVFICELFL